VAKNDLGTKRQCQSCGAKFYDLGKEPIICPKCATVFVPVALTRARPEPKQVEADDTELEVAADGPELVSLDEVEAEEGKDDLPIDDVEIEDDVEADDTFLEEEEEGDDVVGLIDGEIEDDEET
jgi:uncharacterized protein (TIGR02300 family)